MKTGRCSQHHNASPCHASGLPPPPHPPPCPPLAAGGAEPRGRPRSCGKGPGETRGTHREAGPGTPGSPGPARRLTAQPLPSARPATLQGREELWAPALTRSGPVLGPAPAPGPSPEWGRGGRGPARLRAGSPPRGPAVRGQPPVLVGRERGGRAGIEL